MKKRYLLTAAIAAFLFVVFGAAGLYASDCPDVVKMEDPIYDSHKKGIVEFTHKHHVETYGLGCGDCHHDKDGKPLTDLKCGDTVQPCSACHKKPGDVPKKDLKGLSGAEKMKVTLEYQAGAVHENCRECHKKWNKEHGKKGKDGAPVSCTACHPRD